jgi:hypothetical protein
MTPPGTDSADQPQPPAPADEPAEGATGLPWPRTWPGVYLFVMSCFIIWVALLVALERVFS